MLCVREWGRILEVKDADDEGRIWQIGYKLNVYFYIRQIIDFEPQYPEDPDIACIYPSNDQIMTLSVPATE